MTWTKLLLLLGLIGGVGALLLLAGHHLTLESLANHEEALRRYRELHPALTLAAAFGLYYGLTAIGIPGTWTLSVVYGWLFGFWLATIASSCAATAGATTSMLIGRYLLRDYATAHFGHRLRAAEEELDRHGAQYIIMLRFLWMIPAFAVNYLMALTRVGAGTFFWATQIGLLPGIGLHCFAGAQLKPLRELAQQGIWGVFTPPLLAAFIALALFPISIKAISIWWKRRKALPQEP
ncbi:MAG TPA: VTT domain-containing protein [Pirellulales bacterium]|jgi:uncharacterized membrane protein YdjX (TVP38/TMEM64 family)|nr:VTT domain-containing protein [Pirellulales bacterium]